MTPAQASDIIGQLWIITILLAGILIAICITGRR